MSQGARVHRPDRFQLRWDVVSLDSQLPPEHRARLVWSFVSTLDLGAFYATIKARDDQAGRPASDPAVLLALWLYAILDGVGAARAIERLCQQHAAYRWLCGGVAVNHDMLSAFRRENGARLDDLLTHSLTGLIAEGLVSLEEVAIDGTKVRARASRGSLVQGAKLARIEAAVTARIAALRHEIDADPAAGERRQQARLLRAAQEQAGRVKRAQEHLAARQREAAERAKRHRKEEAAKPPPSVSTSDPEVRQMRMPDHSVYPAWNVQIATARGFIVAIDPTDRRQDGGLAGTTVAEVARRCSGVPERLLGDGTAIVRDDIVGWATCYPGLEVYSPEPRERAGVTAETARKRRWQRGREAEPIRAWRERMASALGEAIYRRRKLTEHVHAKLKNRGFAQMLTHGIATVRAVCRLHALAHNLLQAHYLRTATP
jgi:transposase